MFEKSLFFGVICALSIVACTSETAEEETSSSSENELGARGNGANNPLAGTWKYEAGSAFTLSCGGQVIQTMDLTHAGKNGEAGMFTFVAKDDGSIYEVDGIGCQYYFNV